MDAEARKRLRWVELFLQVKNCSIVCLRCGISRPTLRKWLRRYEDKGAEGLIGESRKPKSSPATKILDQHRAWIRELRNRCLGSRRIQSELKRAHDFDVSRTTIVQSGTPMQLIGTGCRERVPRGSTLMETAILENS